MNRKIILTCALTGAGDTTAKSEFVPVTPEEIANDAIAAARAGASVVHIHVRDLQTRLSSRKVEYYREVVERVRASEVDPVINLTAGMGGDLVLDPQNPTAQLPGTDLVSGLERLPHVEQLLPEICTLDCGSLNFGDGSNLYVSTPDMLREGAARIQQLGVRPELEIFDTGNLWFANVMVQEGLIDPPPLYQLCMGVPYGAPVDPGLLHAMVNLLPKGAEFTSFAIGANQLPWVAQSVLAGGHARVGLEDNLYLSKGVKATNAQLTDRAVGIIESLGAEVATPDEAREILDLKVQIPAGA
ncbi:NADPH:quinone reductase [Arthrobacter sp. MYb211]|uniref:3-keto-5-aminohexanoate cleavage protein n=1 Tax=unclassified Arthrobacter TaxID=235627 RepID=UPI000CFB92A1|nr:MULTISPECIES: 3-keto-5-aminohexanoate cleavage protein [unclassified Arthrobacter]PRA00040.1 NADPH:quinone reductase [Arthrobacter sp. MYb229]PRA08243.1 NADPH:quinone reductase [Arthrobacter sp. MYb221]PRB48286.1 NADPH:quinone reductase [Arthrobacter sp. MYb216]PRC02859.1 NADPH:quinone reductase [Arthrobacter sp. MYb211]